MNNGGDSLARGMKSATFGPPKISQEKWDALWSTDTEEESTYEKCPSIIVKYPSGVREEYSCKYQKGHKGACKP